jgi:hypothetical protein
MSGALDRKEALAKLSELLARFPWGCIYCAFGSVATKGSLNEGLDYLDLT